MNTTARIATVLISTALFAACGDRTSTPASSGAEPKTMIGKAVEEATDKARRELAKENVGMLSVEGQPKAEITPQGDLLIGGKAATIDAKQRTLLLEHRKRIVAVAETGMDIGVQGADLAGKAIGDAIGSIFNGNTDELEKKVEAEGKKIEKSAARLCELLSPLLASQQTLAQALPAFKPYATMTQKDVDECSTEKGNGNGGEIIGKVIESAFNGELDIEVNIDDDKKSDGGMNAAAEAEAAGAAGPAKAAESEKR
ncbi:MAG: hypothetical protein KA144_10285 [Xanthomonadaceae bacterium]|nr:hypothetical protein [Xanthomonadaceae bacterium]